MYKSHYISEFISAQYGLANALRRLASDMQAIATQLEVNATASQEVAYVQQKDAYGPDELKAWRKANKFTQSEIARELGVSRLTIANWEAGRSKPARNLRQNLEKVLPGSTTKPIPLEPAVAEPRPPVQAPPPAAEVLPPVNQARARYQAAVEVWIAAGKPPFPQGFFSLTEEERNVWMFSLGDLEEDAGDDL
jgi:transcriptional regulator with XRE-family HTH domain